MSKQRSKRFRALAGKVDHNKRYSVEEAVKILKSAATAKFTESVDLAMKLDIDSKQPEQMLRGNFSLPHGTGKSVRIIAFCEGAAAQDAKAAGAIEAGGEELVQKVEGGWSDFDIAIAHPQMMRLIGKLGRVLGPQGKMPSPKSGTVTPDVPKAVREFAAGKIEYRTDNFGNIHVAIGTVKFEDKDLVENARAFIDHIVRSKPSGIKGVFVRSAALSTTMGVGVRLAVAG
jgi:large subunit ribosomal protein L1